ncbi:MAG: hypothetical protein IKI75_10550 [Lachnospiraceae bacterium]|nr:hypothetical protein [Lachnospiraceae bacterium]
MRKQLFFIIAASLFILSACGDDTPGNGGSGSGPAATEAPTATPTPTPIPEAEVPVLKDSADLSDYDFHFNAGGDAVIVMKGGSFGAADISGNLIVPCSYTGYTNPTSDGLFVMTRGNDYRDFSYTVFNASGDKLYEGSDEAVAYTGGFCVAKGIEAENSLENDVKYAHTELSYYDREGQLITTLEEQYARPYGILSNTGFNDGSAVTVRTAGPFEVRYFEEDIFSCILPYEIGYVSADGTVEWTDGDGYSDDDPALVDYLTGEDAIAKYKRTHWGTNKVNPAPPEVFIPAGPADEGYMVGINSANGNWQLRDADGLVCEIAPDAMSLSENGALQYAAVSKNFAGRSVPSYVASEEDPGLNGGVLLPFRNDGVLRYNVSSNVVFPCGEKLVLADLGSGEDEFSYSVFDRLSINDELYWPAENEGRYFYVDHSGSEAAEYDFCSEFKKGVALVIKGGNAFLIDEYFNELQDLGPADSVRQCGELYSVTKGGTETLYTLSSELKPVTKLPVQYR